MFCVIATQSNAQDGSSHEIGFITGSASFTTDYGQRNNFMANVGGNVGPGFGLVYYLNFTDYRYRWNQRTDYFAEHFRLRGEISYMSAKLEHFGIYAQEQSPAGEQLRAMHGKTSIFNVGAQLEFHIVDIVDFGSRRIHDLQWSPYASAGVFVDFYNPSISSSYDPVTKLNTPGLVSNWQDPGILYPKWDNNLFPNSSSDKRGTTLSATLGLGTRHKLGEYSDVLIEARWQYFFSNWVDGLNARQDPANKYNDWLLWVHVGYVYYLN